MNKDRIRDNKLKFYTYKLDMNILNIFAIVLFVIVGLLVYLIEYQDNYVINYKFSSFFILMFIWLIIHELLHGLAFLLFKEVKKSAITFGMFLEKGVFYCMCKQKITKKVILTSLLFPVTIIGFITLIIGMVINNYELVFLSILNIVSSIGDIIMTIYFIKAPPDIVYLDLDDCTSFTVLSSQALDHLKVPGIILDKKGDYQEKEMVPQNFKKLTISKASYVLLLVVFIFIIINLIGGKI